MKSVGDDPGKAIAIQKKVINHPHPHKHTQGRRCGKCTELSEEGKSTDLERR